MIKSVLHWSIGGQERDQTADLPLFRIKDGGPWLAVLVFSPAGALSPAVGGHVIEQGCCSRN
jgi:hypothetical protein